MNRVIYLLAVEILDPGPQTDGVYDVHLGLNVGGLASFGIPDFTVTAQMSRAVWVAGKGKVLADMFNEGLPQPTSSEVKARAVGIETTTLVAISIAEADVPFTLPDYSVNFTETSPAAPQTASLVAAKILSPTPSATYTLPETASNLTFNDKFAAATVGLAAGIVLGRKI